MDIIPPQLNCIKVYGKLTLVPDLNVTISASCIEVYGTFDISDGYGGPYKGNVNVQLYGTKQNSVPIVVGQCLDIYFLVASLHLIFFMQLTPIFRRR